MIKAALERYWPSRDEQYKDSVEFALHSLAKTVAREQIFRRIRGGERIYDPRLFTEIAGIDFENPVMLGAGYDKKGWLVDASYLLDFSADEVGSVPLDSQLGNPPSRLDYNTRFHVARNSFGFNSIGALGVDRYLGGQQRLGRVGISLTKNKETKEEDVPQRVAEVAGILYEYADYFVINFSSPNTPGLRDMLLRQLRDTIRAVNTVQDSLGERKPIFIKTMVDMSEEDVLEVIQIASEEGATGIIDTNTTTDEYLKAKYGWGGKPGGLSGNDPTYRARADKRMKFITEESAGTSLARIAVGAINNAEAAIGRMNFGAQGVQVVTAMRERKLRIAQEINLGFMEEVERENLDNISEIVGINCK